MKKITFLLFFASSLVIAQVTDLVEPKSWNQDISEDNLEVVSIPFNELSKYLDEDDEAVQQSIAKPYRFGARLEANVTKAGYGETTILDNGDEIWKIGFESRGAKTINFILKNYYLADGAELYVYNEDKSMKIGPYTSTENNNSQEVTTWPVDGDMVFVELYEPKKVLGQSTFTISEIVHGYRTITKNDLLAKALNDSGPCNVDADCPLGDNFEMQKKSVVMIVVGGDGFCTGTLVNNTSEDKTPYILTANHCFATFSEAPVGATANIVFRFNWISPNPSCATFANSTNEPNFLQTGNGGIIRASDGDSDMLLFETSNANAIPSDWDVVFAGWSRSTTSPSFTTGIHHPSGDIMKICRDDDAPLRGNIGFNGFTNRVWFIDDGAAGGWEQGVTEPGSSGSQLLDANGKVIGVLSGGSAACIGTNDNGGFDFYGRLDRGWSDVGPFLDPTSTNAITTEHLPNLNLSVSEFDDPNGFEVYPNPTNGIISIQTGLFQQTEDLEYQLYDIQGKLIKTGKIELSNQLENKISLEHMDKGIYLLKLSSNSISEVKKIIKE